LTTDCIVIVLKSQERTLKLTTSIFSKHSARTQERPSGGNFNVRGENSLEILYYEMPRQVGHDRRAYGAQLTLKTGE